MCGSAAVAPRTARYSDETAPGAMLLDEPPDEMKRPPESKQEMCNGKKPRTEDPLVAANALACFAGPGSEDGFKGSDTTDAAPSSEKKQPAKQDEAPEGSVHNDDNDTETTMSCTSDSVVGAAGAAGAGAAGVAAAAGAAAAAASGVIQKAMLAVKQEQHVLAEREEAVKRQRSKAARFCAESRARRRLRTMIFDQSVDPATQQLRFTQLQQLQQTQIRNQARCHPLTPHPGLSSPIVAPHQLVHCASHQLPFYASQQLSQQLQYGVGIARPAVVPILQTAQFATPMSYVQPNPAAGVSFPFFPDPVSTALHSLPPHGSLAWNPFAPSAMPIATPMTQTPLAHAPMGFPAANAFLPQRGMARWVALAPPPAPAPVAFAPIAPGFVSPPTSLQFLQNTGPQRPPYAMKGGAVLRRP